MLSSSSVAISMLSIGFDSSSEISGSHFSMFSMIDSSVSSNSLNFSREYSNLFFIFVAVCSSEL